jgi:hypothetical protein
MLMGAAAFAVGALSSSAQTVYSVNVVGYVNTVVYGTDYANVQPSLVGHPQYTMISNPLDNGSGNLIQDLFAAQGSGIYGDTAYIFNNGLQSFAPNLNSYGWNVNSPIPPGSGMLFYNVHKTFTNTFVGTVLQGNQTNVAIPGYSVISSIWPASGYLQNLGFTAGNGDTAYMFSQFLQSFGPQLNSYGWTGSTSPLVSGTYGPFITNGVSFLYLNTHASNFWKTDFTVH